MEAGQIGTTPRRAADMQRQREKPLRNRAVN
jgi:hypothetical protein